MLVLFCKYVLTPPRRNQCSVFTCLALFLTCVWHTPLIKYMASVLHTPARHFPLHFFSFTLFIFFLPPRSFSCSAGVHSTRALTFPALPRLRLFLFHCWHPVLSLIFCLLSSSFSHSVPIHLVRALIFSSSSHLPSF